MLIAPAVLLLVSLISLLKHVQSFHLHIKNSHLVYSHHTLWEADMHILYQIWSIPIHNVYQKKLFIDRWPLMTSHHTKVHIHTCTYQFHQATHCCFWDHAKMFQIHANARWPPLAAISCAHLLTLIALLIHTILNCNSYRFHLCGVAGLEDLKEMSILTL